MAITNLDGYISSAKQKVPWVKTAPRTTVANGWFSLFDTAGQPGAGTLAGTSTTAGVVPTDATAGCPPITDFGAGNLGYLTRVEFANTVACRVALFDLLWKGGAYAFNANVALASQPSYLGRDPSGIGQDLELWVETVTAFTGNLSISVGYTNSAGVASRSTGTIATGIAPTVGRMIQLQLQAGDAGIRSVDQVTATVATAGTFNVLVLRPLWTARVPLANFGDVHDLIRAGMPRVYQDSALFVAVNADSTSSGIPECSFQVSNG